MDDVPIFSNKVTCFVTAPAVVVDGEIPSPKAETVESDSTDADPPD